jgi:hypothetical protein
MKTQPLTDLEMYDLIQTAYPGKFPDDIDPDGAWDAVMEFVDNFSGFDELADLLARVTTLTMPMTTALSGELVHCLGAVYISEGKANMVSVVKRKVTNAKLTGRDYEDK